MMRWALRVKEVIDGVSAVDLELQVEHFLVAVADHVEQVFADPRLDAVRPWAVAGQSLFEHAQGPPAPPAPASGRNPARRRTQ